MVVESLNPPILHRKELLLAADDPRRGEYEALTAACESVGLFDDPRRIGYRRQWLTSIRERCYRLDGHALVPVGNDDSGAAESEEAVGPRTGWEASRHLTALVRYGFSAPIQSLARYGFLDGRFRVFDYGMVRLTYGFCSPELARKIPGRIDPKRDQHAAHEVNRLGNRVCERLGAAVDFLVEDESMLEVAQWIVANTPFDRLYFYGDDLPIHVSYGPSQDRQIVRMVAAKGGRLVPRVLMQEAFLGLA